ncbi:hypothetical protein GCM10027059_42410 [Myceligenerans halotolerans]
MVDVQSFSRPFQVWIYSTSHRLLLLRSARTAAHDSRIDVLFGFVEHMNVATNIDYLELQEASSVETQAYVDSYGARIPDRLSLTFLSHEKRFFVVGAPPMWHEDSGGYDDPSYFEANFLMGHRP